MRENRTTQIIIRCTPAQKARWKAAALLDPHCGSLSEWVCRELEESATYVFSQASTPIPAPKS